MGIPEDAPNERLVSRRIHIMGLGSIGTFIAHSLKCLPNPPPITLMLHKQQMYDDFKSKSRVIRLINKKTDVNDEQTGYDVDLLGVDRDTGYAYWTFIPDRPDQKKPTSNPITEEEILESGEIYIHTLIVTVKGPATKSALRAIKHRVNAQTTICLIQNGMGQVEELNNEVFTDPDTRPTYMLGIISHGVHLTSSFIANHAGFGTVALGIVRDTDKYPLPPKTSIPSETNLSEEDRKRWYPSDKELYSNISSRYLLRTLTRYPILACAAFPYLDLFQLQLEKLAMNAVLNPLTALLDVPNGAMLYNGALSKVQRLLFAEISMVFRGLPEFEGHPNIRMRFSPDRLETLFLGVSTKTAANSSSMREDIRKLKNTEVGYINGYIVKRGEQQGIKCVLNYMIMQLVMAKSWSQRTGEGEILPYGVSKIQGQLSPDSQRVMMDDHGKATEGQRF
jgi:2-dehydropantoate 2-reductase